MFRRQGDRIKSDGAEGGAGLQLHAACELKPAAG